MASGPLAASSGKKMGAGLAPIQASDLNQLTLAPRPTRPPFIAPDEAFGLTIIVGGTNVRFCISRHVNDLPVVIDCEPIEKTIKWQQLNMKLRPVLRKRGLKFEDAKDLVMAQLAAKCINHIKAQFPRSQKMLPIHNLKYITFSVAGLVEGHDENATVTTTNTGINLAKEPLAKAMLHYFSKELSSRKLPALQKPAVTVLNDADAGTRGEIILGALSGCTNGLFVILGTGVGSKSLINGRLSNRYSELGHRIIYDSAIGGYRLLSDREFAQIIDAHGNYKPLPPGKRYLENDIAGPWLALRFAKSLAKEGNEGVQRALAERLRRHFLKKAEEEVDKRAHLKPKQRAKLLAKLQKEIGDVDSIVGQLVALGDLPEQQRHRWAINSPGHLIRAINEFIMYPDPGALFTAQLAPNDPEQALVLAGFNHWKKYFEDIGRAMNVVYADMKEKGVAAEKIVLGGGVGEACARYNPFLLERALKLIEAFSKTPPGIIEFSNLSPTARESAYTYQRLAPPIAT